MTLRVSPDSKAPRRCIGGGGILVERASGFSFIHSAVALASEREGEGEGGGVKEREWGGGGFGGVNTVTDRSLLFLLLFPFVFSEYEIVSLSLGTLLRYW